MGGRGGAGDRLPSLGGKEGCFFSRAGSAGTRGGRGGALLLGGGRGGLPYPTELCLGGLLGSMLDGDQADVVKGGSGGDEGR